MKEIKTVWSRLDFSADFDKDVNNALKAGWELVQRSLYRSNTENSVSILYAEMEREKEEP